ncbi:pantoate--beta-alanine ligase [Oceanibium sediminis]|uniref:pantoate--beta-alanine ligase n=1 Tax=Oceanibium sediminis TaxID=2026339 RepID=UPI000DD30437|nr:pantoate--beta-alanine ligase [Oceanibium sediminis]
MEVITSIPALRARIGAMRANGQGIGLVPTLGGLHDGHAALVEAARAAGDLPVATLFLNPAQFSESEDLERYPAERDADIALLKAAGAALVFAPATEEIYPPGFSTRISITAFEDVLCAQNRPGHFNGVSLVVCKLLCIARAERAYFGEKDWQQCLVVKALVRDLNIDTDIVTVPTARDSDGLALSTRNRYLTAAERRLAPQLYHEICEAAARIAQGTPTELACAEAQETLTLAGFSQVEYLECRNAETLRLAPSPGRGARVFVAARLGAARLIDNVPVPA